MSEHVKEMIKALNKLNIRYIFTGAFALAYYGFPRASADIDVIVEQNRDKLMKLALSLKNEYDIPVEDVSQAVIKCEHFAVFHREKLFPYFDFKVACNEDEKKALREYVTVNYHGVKCRISSVENLIVKKLEWGDLEDVRSILYRQKGKLNWRKLLSLAREKHLDKILGELKEEICD